MKFEAIIEETFGKPDIYLDDDGTNIKFHCYTENADELKKLWRSHTKFYIVSEDELNKEKNKDARKQLKKS